MVNTGFNNMTVQELIDALNKVEDKTLNVFHCNYAEVKEVDNRKYVVILC